MANNMKLYDLVMENADGSISKKIVMGSSLRSVRASFEENGEILKLKESVHAISKDAVDKALADAGFDATDIGIIRCVLKMNTDFMK